MDWRFILHRSYGPVNRVLPALIARLEALGYDGYFTIEMFSEELWAMPATGAAWLMNDSLLWLCKD